MYFGPELASKINSHPYVNNFRAKCETLWIYITLSQLKFEVHDSYYMCFFVSLKNNAGKITYAVISYLIPFPPNNVSQEMNVLFYSLFKDKKNNVKAQF